MKIRPRDCVSQKQRFTPGLYLVHRRTLKVLILLFSLVIQEETYVGVYICMLPKNKFGNHITSQY